jgi:hypothetical protein
MNPHTLPSIVRDRSSNLLARTIAGAVWFSLLGSTVPSMSQTCLQVVQQIKQFSSDLQAAGGCPVKPVTSPRIPTLRPPGGNLPTPTCVPNTQKIDAWATSHKAEYDSLTNKLAACVATACPPIHPVSIELCNAVRPGGHCIPNPDTDGDGIPDSVEAMLIARFSPFLRFSLSGNVPEIYRPLDPLTYVAAASLVDHSNQGNVLIPNSQLRADPTLILSSTLLGSPSNIMDSYSPNGDFTACVNSTPHTSYSLKANQSDGSVMGADWSVITSQKNVGLFAHVSPFTPYVAPNPETGTKATGLGDLATQCQRYVNDHPATPVIPPSVFETACTKDTCYKIEYYQLFGLNNDFEPFNIGDHEGDLSIITMVYDMTLDKLMAVSHWAHGYEMRFDLLAGGGYPNCPPNQDPVVGAQITCSGANSHYTSFNILKIAGLPLHAEQDEPEKAQNNVISFAKDLASGEFSHPVVFVEYGSHEFWPTSQWGAQGAPSHNGMDTQHSYLSQQIPNLGEIEHPNGKTASVFIGFNGYWGTWDTLNTSPPGPSLHSSWNWFIPNRTPISCQSAEN